MICSRCGTNNDEDAKFCVKCGNKLVVSSPPKEEPDKVDPGKRKKALEAYEGLCRVLDENKLQHIKDENNLMVRYFVREDGLIHEYIAVIDEEKQVMVIYAPITKVPEDKRGMVAQATCLVNYSILNGCFEMDFRDGDLRFRMAEAFMEMDLSKDVFTYMLLVSAVMMKRFGENFMLLSKGLITLQ